MSRSSVDPHIGKLEALVLVPRRCANRQARTSSASRVSTVALPVSAAALVQGSAGAPLSARSRARCGECDRSRGGGGERRPDMAGAAARCAPARSVARLGGDALRIQDRAGVVGGAHLYFCFGPSFARSSARAPESINATE